MKGIIKFFCVIAACVFAFLIGISCAEPEASPVKPPEMPAVIESSEFLPEPDEIVIWWKNGNKISVSEKNKKRLYHLFCQIMQCATECTARDGYSPGNTIFSYGPVMEFVYHERHEYVAPTDGSEAVIQDSFEYDSFLFSIWEGGIGESMLLRLGDTICGISTQDPMCLTFSSGADQFQSEIYQFVSRCINESIVGSYPDVDPEPAESETFVERPDSMRLICQGQVKTLTTEQQEALYVAFGKMMDGLVHISVLRDYFSTGYMNGFFDLEGYICLEFLYDQRQKYIGEEIKPNDDELCYSIKSFEFDSIIFVISDEFPRVYMRKNGRYYGLCETSLHFQFWVIDFEFHDMIKELAV